MTNNLIIKNYIKKFPNVSKYDISFFDMVTQYSLHNKSLTEIEINHLSSLYEHLKVVDNALKPFRDVGLYYEIAVTGGSVYDLLTHNLHFNKDYDFVVNFEHMNSQDYSFDNSISPYLQFIHNTIDTLYAIYLPQKRHSMLEYTEEEFSILFSHIVKLSFTNTVTYQSNNFNTEDYLNVLMSCLIKINDPSLDKPIDLMLSKNTISNFCESMDFNLCKNFIYYRHSSFDFYKLDNPHGFSLNSFLDNLYIHPKALYDIHEKHLSISIGSFKEEHILFFMKKHYVRLKEKLPHFTLNLLNKHYNPELASSILASILDEKLPIKNNAYEHKIKI